jgi:hypothetical protein
MSVREAAAPALALHADTESATIVVVVDGPVDDLALARIDAALRPFLEVRPFTVRLDLHEDVA